MTFRGVRNALYPLIGVAIILLIWQLYTDLFGINRIVLPSPTDILWASVANWHVLLRECWPTFLESVLGFILAVVIGIPFAVCVANSRVLNLTLYPILIATQSIPKVAVAPIILVWFGLGMQSKLVIAFLIGSSRSWSTPRQECGQHQQVYSNLHVRFELHHFRFFSKFSFHQRCLSSLRARKSL